MPEPIVLEPLAFAKLQVAVLKAELCVKDAKLAHQAVKITQGRMETALTTAGLDPTKQYMLDDSTQSVEEVS